MEKRLSNKCVSLALLYTDFFKYMNIVLLLTTFLIVKYKLILYNSTTAKLLQLIVGFVRFYIKLGQR